MRIARIAVVLASLIPAAAFSFGLNDTPPLENHLDCRASAGDVNVTSFANVLTYRIHGTCMQKAPFSKGIWFPQGTYDVVATWRETDGQFEETIKGPQSVGEFVDEPKHGPWEMTLGGTCKLDPFMSGADASSCSGRVKSSSNNALFKFSEKAFPVSPRVLAADVRSAVTGKTLAAIEAEHQAPKIKEPTEGATYKNAVPLEIDAGKGSPTKTFKLKWEAWIVPGPGAPGQPHWESIQGMPDESGPTAHLPENTFNANYGKWRLQARASQSAKAQWSDWRTFERPVTKPWCEPSGKTYDAKYDVSATPASLTPGQTVMVPIRVTNRGTLTWTVAGQFHLSYHWLQNGVLVVADGQRTSLPVDMPTCNASTFPAKLVAPPAPGTYTLEWDMVQEGVAWFSNQGVPTANRTVVVSSSAAPPPPKK